MNAELINESRKLLAKALHLSRVGVLFFRLSDLKIIEINEAFAKAFNYRRHELIGKSIAVLRIGEAGATQQEFTNLLTERKTLRGIERQFRTRDGELRCGRIAADLIEIDGELYGFVIGRDITEERKNKAEKAHPLAILESATDFIGIADREGRIIYCNQALREFINLNERESLCNVYIPDYHPEWMCKLVKNEALSAVIRDGIWKGETLILNRRTGEKTPFSQILIAHKDAAGKVEFISAIARDISEIKKREAQSSAIFENSPDGILITDDEGRFCDANPALCSLLEMPREEIVNRTVADLARLVSDEKVSARWREFLANGKESGIIPLKRRDGKTVIAEYAAKANFLPGRHLSVIRDVTHRFRTKMSLRKSETRFRNVVESMNEGLLITDLDDNVLYANPRLIEMIGYSLEEILGKCAYKFLLPPENWAELLEKNKRRKAGISERYEHEIVRKDGSRFWCESNAVPFYNDRSEVVGTIGVITDISERREFQQQLAERQEQLARAQEIAHIGSWEWNLKTDTMYWSDEKYRLYGLKPQSLALDWETFLQFVYPDDRAVMKEAAEALLGEKEIPPLEYRIIRQDNGEMRTLRSVGKLVFDDTTGEPLKAVGTDQDITEMRTLEEQLRQAQKLESVGLLAGGIAHDFNNMLTAINGYSDLLLAKLSADDPLRLMVEEVKKAGQRSATLTAQLLAYSRKQILQPKVIKINSIISDINKMLQRVIGEDIDLITDLEPNLWSIKADPSQIVQIVLNLAVNARDAMPEGGRLLIETQNVSFAEESAARRYDLKPGDYVMLTVADNGIGIDPEMQKRIFEPFFTTKEVGKGTGMGLATVDGIVRQSGGGICLISESGRGAIFKIYLPKAEKESVSFGFSDESSRHARCAETILLVEDEDLVRTVIKQILEECGYTVLEAPTGGDAILLFERERRKIDLLLTDVVMPNMSGRELANHLLKINPELKVLFMSGYTTSSIVHHGVLDDDTEFIQKPFTSADLVERIKVVLNR